MGTIHIKEMTGGLDARRLPETTPGGVLIRADNGHITRGGEFEARPAFVKEFDLPSGVVGMAHTREGIVVFGAGPRPEFMNRRIGYQRLQNAGKTLARIRDWELFDGKLYVVAEYADGTIANFYDGQRLSTWDAATAAVQVRIDEGGVTPSARATAEFRVEGGTNQVINTVTSIRVSGTEILDGVVRHTGNNATTAAAIAAQINARPTTPSYTATVAGNVVTLRAGREGTAANGRTITWQTTGNFFLDDETVFAGGRNEVVPQILDVTLGDKQIIREPVAWAGSPQSTASALADAINEMGAEINFRAFVSGTLVTIRARIPGAIYNDQPLTVRTSGYLQTSFPDGLATSGGAELGPTQFAPAQFVLTVREKMYAGSGSNLHYSAVQGPTYWQPDGEEPGEIGAGFSNIASSNSDADEITALARYFDKLAVFTGDTVQTWFIDPDPDLVVQSQVLENTGTDCPRSVTQFGDADIFYLDTSGLRSLRARDSSNAAASTDVGVPIDDILSEKLALMTFEQRRNVIGLINPADKRFWLIMGSEIFVYSYFPNSKVNAWTRYEVSLKSGIFTTRLNVTEAMTFNRRVFLRAGDAIYSFGGWGRQPVYDDTQATAWLPMLDANSPSAEKDWRGIDAAVEGDWEVFASFDPNRPDVQDQIANLTETTYGLRRIPVKGKSTHIGMRFVSRGGPAKLSSLVIHFDGKVNED